MGCRQVIRQIVLDKSLAKEHNCLTEGTLKNREVFDKRKHNTGWTQDPVVGGVQVIRSHVRRGGDCRGNR